MTDPGAANNSTTSNSTTSNSINDTTVHGTALQMRDARSVVINNYGTPAVPSVAPAPPETPHAWAREVAASVLWTSVAEGRDAAPFREAACAIAATLGELHDADAPGLAEDPWWVPEFADRFHRQVSQLVCVDAEADAVVTKSWGFQPAEALLLVLTPYLSQTLWVRTAAARVDVRPADLGLTRADGRRAGFERFFDRGYERLVRRARLGLSSRPGAESDIGWWLFHQWLDHGLRGTEDHERAYEELIDELPLEDPFLREVFQHRRAGQLLYGLRLPPAEMCRPERLKALTRVPAVSVGSRLPQRIRVELLSPLLGLARATALDAPSLPDDLVENLGIPHRVDLPELHATLAEVTWDSDSGPLVLHATECRHEAVIETLRRHVGQIDLLLYDIHRAHRDESSEPWKSPRSLELLRVLPQRASAEGVEAARGHDDRPGSGGYGKFQVDPRRMQELLMGDQLYRSPGLAIRELYQNALDACRYRKARTEYLATKPDTCPDDWRGRISFTQGADPDGRPYLQCEDNGIGMGESELSRVFARAGTRFTDLTAVRNERETWEAAGIRLHPVSRFGIGVLSYFMIADEIEVITRKLGDDGATSEPCFKVAIYGPHHLFRIEKSTGRREPGTTVRLYLREGAPSCVTELTQLLGIAEFETTAEHGGRLACWEAGVFRARRASEWGEERGLHAYGVEVPGPVPEGGGGPSVVWCENGGALLVDGILTRPTHRHGVLRSRRSASVPRGAVVNLTGDRVPKLSVDRLQILSDVSNDVEELLLSAVDELVASTSPLLSFGWISEVAEDSYALADLIVRAAMAADRKLDGWDGRPVRITEVGCLPRDKVMLSAAYGSQARRLTDVPDHILLWRLLAVGAGEPFVEVVPELGDVGRLLPALPSDGLLVDLPDAVGEEPGTILQITEQAYLTPRQVARRIVELRLAELDLERYPDRPADPVEHALLHRRRPSAYGPSMRRPVPLEYFLQAYVDLDLVPAETAARLAPYGFDVSLAERLPERPEKTDLRLLSENGGGERDWLRADVEVPPGHVVWMAARTGHSVPEVRRRLERYGLRVGTCPDRPTNHDVRLLSRSLEGRPAWLRAGEMVSAQHIQRAADACEMSGMEVVATLAAYGLGTEKSPADTPPVSDGRADVGPSEHHANASATTGEWLVERMPWPVTLPEELTDLDEALLDPGLGLWRGARDSSRDVSALRLLLAARRLRRSPRSIAARLESYGFRVAPYDFIELDKADVYLAMLSRRNDGTSPWLTDGGRVGLLRLCAASRKLGLALPETAETYRRLGVDVPDVAETIRAALAKLPRAEEA